MSVVILSSAGIRRVRIQLAEGNPRILASPLVVGVLIGL
jgi:hypothetical protein